MALYKGIPLPDRVAPLARHMHALDDRREALASLRGTWDTLGLLAHLAQPRVGLDEVRASFAQLATELLAGLAEESLALAEDTLGDQARIAIELLARELSERRAGAALLAADDAVVQACVAHDDAAAAALHERLRAHAALYPAWRDIVLMAPDGQVRVRLAAGFAGRSRAPALARALASPGVVQAHEPADFCGGARTLAFASRVEHEGRAVGVLALVFDLEREATRVFERLATRDELVAFVDEHDLVVASNDATRLPPGRRLALAGEQATLRLGGVPYLAAQRRGRHSAGWSAVALAPAELALAHDEAVAADPQISGESMLPAQLLDVPQRAREIERRLERMVWNGRIRQANAGPGGGDGDDFAHALMAAIAATGRRTEEVLDLASADLLDIVATGLEREAALLAGLAVNLLGRNARERASDVRWWATDPALAALDPVTARARLARLHERTPACANVLLFDAQGVAVAASRDDAFEGRRLPGAWVDACLQPGDPIRPTVSPLEPTPLYGDAPTSIHAAPLLVDGQVRGGVALVFDGTPRFESMLRAALPERPGAVAAFCRPDGSVVARTGDLPVTLPSTRLALAPGQSWSGVLTENAQCFVVCAAAADDAPLIGVVVTPCGRPADPPAATAPQVASVGDGIEVATFLIGEHLLGVLAGDVIECIEVAPAVRVWRGGFAQRHVGFVTWREAALPLLDVGADIHVPAARHRHAIVLRAGDHVFGLLVSELGPIAHMKLTEDRSRAGGPEPSRLISQLARSGATFLPVLSPDAVFGGAVG
jgi:chemotaxis signal transduction protein